MNNLPVHLIFDLLLPQFDGLGGFHASRNASQTTRRYKAFCRCNQSRVIYNVLTVLFFLVLFFFTFFLGLRFQFTPKRSVDIWILSNILNMKF